MLRCSYGHVIAQRELRNNNADILNRVEAGESFVVTRNGVAVADVVPHSASSEPPMFPSTKDLAARHRGPRTLRQTVTRGCETSVRPKISSTTIPSTPVPEHALALLDTSCVIDFPGQLDELAQSAAVSTLTIAELAYGIHHDDPFVAATRETRYRNILNEFGPIPYSARAAHLYGAIAASVRKSGRNPRPRRIDLMLASVAAELGAVLLTRNPADFAGIGNIAHVIAV